jgi:cyclopropane fatty-acyl-phospholipid synthase-like methyltransferase
LKSLLQTFFENNSSAWHRYPADMLRTKLYRFKSRLGLTSAFERRQAMVGPSHLWKMKRDFQIGYLKTVGLAPEHYLLDLGCGVLRGGLPLIEYLHEGHYYGIESRKAVLDEGTRALEEAGLQSKSPTLLVIDDLSSATLDRKLDFIWAFSVLIHMEDTILNSCLNFVSRHLRQNGRMYANVSIGNEKDSRWQGFPFVSRSSEFYQSAALRHGLHALDVGTLQSLGHISGSSRQDQQMMLEFVRK